MSPIHLVHAIFEKHQILPEDSLVVGVSGGVDSMVLLDVVSQIHPTDKIFVCHIDHSIREESSSDAEFVKTECEKRGVSCEIVRVDISAMAKERKISVEAAGRIFRYDVFEKVRALEKARFVLTAHHKDDSIETVLMNLIRGTRLRGLSGMEERQGVLLRPLLQVSKFTLQEYARENAIPHREDATNADSRYIRNRIRNEILPEMEQINPEVRKTLSDFSEYARELDTMIE